MTQSTAGGPRASVVILNLNGRRYLDTCLEAVLSQELDGGAEVLLVDNGSSDGSVEHVRRRWPQVRVVEAGRNLGFAAGNNLGIEQARGEFLVLLNNDTRARSGWLAALVAAAEEDDSIAAVTSKLVYMSRPGIIQNAGSLLLSDGSGGDRGNDQPDATPFDTREEVFGACGCAMLLRRAALRDVGLLDPTFFCYYEDTDLSWRLRLRGWRIVYEPAAVVEHVHSGTSVEWSPFFTFHVDRNRLFMILKNAPAGFVVSRFLAYGKSSLGMAARAVVRTIRPERSPSAGPPRIGVGIAGRARIHGRVLISLGAHLPEMLRKRSAIRRGRTVRDREIMRWLYAKRVWDARSG